MENESSHNQQLDSNHAKSVIEKQLAEVRKTKKMTEDYGTPDFASRMMLKSITILEKRLVEELRLLGEDSKSKTYLKSK